MKKLFLSFLMSFFMFSSLTYAQELPSCDELDGMIEVLDELADALDSKGNIPECSPLDEALGELVDALEEVASIEENQALSYSIKVMNSAWEYNEWNKFKIGLDGAINSLDRIYYNECED